MMPDKIKNLKLKEVTQFRRGYESGINQIRIEVARLFSVMDVRDLPAKERYSFVLQELISFLYSNPID